MIKETIARIDKDAASSINDRQRYCISLNHDAMVQSDNIIVNDADNTSFVFHLIENGNDFRLIRDHSIEHEIIRCALIFHIERDHHKVIKTCCA